VIPTLNITGEHVNSSLKNWQCVLIKLFPSNIYYNSYRVTPRRGDPTESATESRAPMAFRDLTPRRNR